MRIAIRSAVIAALVGALSSPGAESAEVGATAQQLLQTAGVQGGLVVHVGCGDGKLTAALGAEDQFLVQGLDRDAASVQQARAYVQSLGRYGSVSFDRLGGHRLPYVDGLVQLVVAEDLQGVAMDEVTRVLSPGGVALVKRGDRWEKTVKPWPPEIDQWSHFLYDATNNAVSNDVIVGPPRQLQWVGGPGWTRSHDHLASVSALVASGGRIFAIVDEAPIAAVLLQPQWKLVARDAFSGVVLWKRPIARWQWHLRGFRTGPSDLARRLVAVGDRVYVTLGIDEPVSALDAATGKTITTYSETEGALEIVHQAGTLYVVAAGEKPQPEVAGHDRDRRRGFAAVRPQRPAYVLEPPRKRILAVDAATGKVHWEKSDADTAELMPTTLAVGQQRVFFQNADQLLCLDARTGQRLWHAERRSSRSRPTWSAPTLVVYGDVVLSADRAVAPKKTLDASGDRPVEWIVSSAGGQAPTGELIAFSAQTGRRLWSAPARECYNSPVDVLVAGGLVWTGQLVRANEPGIVEGRDPKTGQVVRTRPKDQEFFAAGMGHGRCYRNRATNRFLVLGRSGVEFIDVATGKAVPNHWTRGTCQYGVMPSYGLLYVPPHSCACFIRSKLNNFNCFAPAREANGKDDEASSDDRGSRREKGPAYADAAARPGAHDAADDWPTYRHDAARSGVTKMPLAADLKPTWKRSLGGRLSSVVAAQGRVLVAQVDAHTVHALDAATGEPAWSFTAGGRIDSPPTVWHARVLFGSADGHVYCLRASDGVLVWRFRVAPGEQRIVAFGQLESAWPVPGSVLVHDGVAYCVAGRSSYLDGSLRLCRIDAATGRLLSETVIDHRDPETGYQRKGSVRGTNMPGALPDVLSSDGQSVFMRHSRFDLNGQQQEPVVPHLFSAAGFLDDAWWHRTYWMVGTIMATNYGGWPRSGSQVPAGRLLVLDDSAVYGFGRDQYIHHGAHVGIDGATIFHFNPTRDAERRFTHYRLFAADRPGTGGSQNAPTSPPKGVRRKKAPSRPQIRWQRSLPVLARAMLLAADSLVVAGPPDVFASDDPAAVWQGRRGGKLLVASAADGKIQSEIALDSPPVFDGLAAAAGRLYMATMDGHVVCLSR